MLEILELLIVYTFVLGSIYLLVALGFSLICGVLRIFHLGYAYIFTATVYITWIFMKEFGLGLGPALGVMVAIQAGIAMAAYKGIVKPYLKAEEKMMTAFLLIAIIMEQVALRWYYWGDVHLLTTISPGTVMIGSTVISKQLVFSSLIAIAFTVLFILLFLKTKLGLGVRALSQDVYTSRLMGINVEVIYIFIMVVTLVPVIVGMLLVAPIWAIDPQASLSYMITAILISILGGLGNLKGTLIASYIIGFTHSLVAYGFGEPRLMNLGALVLVFLVLLLRPQGIARSEALW